MGFIDAIKTVYKQYFTFSGRAVRSEYWWWWLFNVIVSVVIALVEGGTTSTVGEGTVGAAYYAGPIGTIWALGNLVPGIAVAVRRLHDIGRSGWWLLLGLIPLIGALVLLYWMCCRGTSGTNRFGPDPFGTDARIFS